MAKDRYKYFRIEAHELLDALSRGALELERSPADRQLVAKLLRFAHTLKGAARVVQLPAIAELAHRAEDALGMHREADSPPVPRERIDVLLRVVDDAVRELSALDPPPADAGFPAAAGSSPGARAGGAGVPGDPGDARAERGPDARGAAGAAGAAGVPGAAKAAGASGAPGAAGSGETRPHGTAGSAGAGTAEGGGATGGGSTRAPAVAGAAAGGPWTSADAGASSGSAEVGRTAEEGGALDSAAAGGGPAWSGAAARAPAPAPVEDLRSVRVDLSELDTVLESVFQASVQMTGLSRQIAELQHAEELARVLSDHLGRTAGDDVALTRARTFTAELRRSISETRETLAASADQAGREIGQVRGSADRLRLLPARAIFGSLERASRDAARATERAVIFETSGGGLRVDAHVLSRVREALMHVVRNAVVHGVESTAERHRRGKAPAGRVHVSVERRGSRLAFTCRDDGGGIDRDAVREVAVRKGLIDPASAGRLEGDALTELLLRGGMTTRGTVTDLAGRGVGLDVLRDTAARLEGQVTIHSDPGAGTAVELVVPMSLAAMTVLHAEGAGSVVALPLDGVRSTAFLEPSRIAQTDDGAAVTWQGQLVPFLPLGAVLGRAPGPEPRKFWTAVFVAAGGHVVAVGVDRLRGTSDVVVRPLPPFLEAHVAVAGAALDAEGNPQIVLDPAGLVAAASRRESAAIEAAPVARPPILVIDDSLTTRMLEQSILESAGYEVELAGSAEDGLSKARARRFGVFVVDVEMPGMDGFEFVRVTRADARLSSTPAILVTSRSAAEDRRRGMEAGASAYIVKGEFDQDLLLATIRQLLE